MKERKEGRKEGRKKGRKEGRKKERKEGRKKERNKETKKKRNVERIKKERIKELPFHCLLFRLLGLSFILFLVSLFTFEQSCAFSNELVH